MKRVRACAMILLAALLGVACSACTSKADVVVATVNGQPLYKWQLDLLVSMQIGNYQQMNGIDLSDSKNWQYYRQFRESLLEDMINQQVSLVKAQELGLDKLTDEELAETEKEYAEQYQTNIEYYAQKYPNDPKALQKGEADLKKAMKSKNLTDERMKQNINENKILMKLYKQAFAEYEATEEEVREWYDKSLAEQKAKFDADPAAYGDDVGALSIYVPEGYVRIKHVLIKISDNTLIKMQDIYNKQAEKMMVLVNMSESSKLKGDDVRIQKEIDDLQAQLDAARDAGLREIQARAEEVLREAQNGVDFDYLIEEYGEDEGMETLPGKVTGYLICPQTTKYYEPFKDAALALQNKGDISGLVATDAGYHVIRLYEKLTAGAMPMENIYDTIADMIMKNKTFTPVIEEREKWKQSMEIVKYLDRI